MTNRWARSHAAVHLVTKHLHARLIRYVALLGATLRAPRLEAGKLASRRDETADASYGEGEASPNDQPPTIRPPAQCILWICHPLLHVGSSNAMKGVLPSLPRSWTTHLSLTARAR
jgi:hypothetical protein